MTTSINKLTPEELEKIRNDYHLYVIHCSGNDPAANDVGKCLQHISALEADNKELREYEQVLDNYNSHPDWLKHWKDRGDIHSFPEFVDMLIRERDQLRARVTELQSFDYVLGKSDQFTPNQTILEWIGPEMATLSDHIRFHQKCDCNDCCHVIGILFSRLTAIKENLEKGN